MSTPQSGAPDGGPGWRPLNPTQRRVLGILIEKSKTTPAGYPMSVNAIVTGCNQKSNRDPQMSLDDIDVSNTLVELQDLGVVSEMDWLGRVPKYRHHAYEWLGVSKSELAVLTELLLRGAQPLGELRARAARMAPIADLSELKPIVAALVDRRLMVEITPPGRGQIVSHNLYLGPELEVLRAEHSRAATPSSPVDALPPRAAGGGPPPVASGGAAPEVAALRAEVARLTERVRLLEEKLGLDERP